MHQDLISLFIGLTVTACNYETQVSLYASDLTEDTADKPIYAPIQLVGTGTFSQEDCDKIRGKVEPSLNRYFQNVEFKGCARDSGSIDRKISFSASVPVHIGSWQSNVTETKIQQPYGVLIGYDQETPKEKLVLIAKGDTYDVFTKELDNELTGSKLYSDGAEITIDLQNDTREQISFIGSGVFVNGTAYGNVRQMKFSLQRRDNLLIQLSDVSSQHIKSDGMELVGTINFGQ
ncbi:DUF7424 family protein [Pseudovibrio denitrificans]|uniref:DUF7424 family protein n=1 Tax=Pseudovibrio denitrificans TaxID=258256 RepID=UPI0040329D4D